MIKDFKSINRGGYHRCSICDCVSNEEIETNLGDYRPNMSFVNDPNNSLHFICVECQEEIDDVLYDYELDDMTDE